MKKKLFILFFLLCGTIWGNSSEKLAELTLKLDSKTISFESPIIRRDDQLMIPLREALPYFNAKMTYQRKEGIYTLIFNQTSLSFAPNTYEFTLNLTKKRFKTPPFYDENVLYIALEDWLSSQGYSYKEKGNQILIKEIKTKISLAAHVIEPKDPDKENLDSSVMLIWGAQHYTLEDAMTLNGILWANIEDILEQEGYVLEFKRTSVKLSKGKQVVTFPLLNADSIFVKKNGHFYTQLNLFFSNLHVGFAQKKNLTYVVLNPISEVISNPLGTGGIQILSQQPLDGSKPIPLSTDNGFYIDIPNSIATNPGAFPLNSPFSKAELRALDSTTTRMTIWFQESRPHSGLIPTSFGGEIKVYSEILSLKEESPNLLKLKSTQPIVYSIGLFEHPHRLVLDIPDSISTLPSVVQVPKGAYYTRVRSSQFQINPSMTRIVFDLTQSATFSIQKKGKLLEINFNLPTTATANKPLPPPVIASSLPLENRVIVIDPGHGGNDPGALSSDKDYEKDFTLDISKRLEKLLTQQGAFVIMCRDGDQNPSLEERTTLANMNKTDAFISVHINSFFNPFISGTETYYYKSKDEHLATLIHQEIVKTLGIPNKGIKKARLYVLRNSTMPSALVEPLFITNDHDFKLLKQPEVRQKMAEAITKGVLRYFKR